MPWYSCFIEGRGFPGEPFGKQGEIGFCTTRFVAADSLQAAETTALAVLKREPALFVAPGRPRPKAARVSCESIEEIAADEVPETQPGLVFWGAEI